MHINALNAFHVPALLEQVRPLMRSQGSGVPFNQGAGATFRGNPAWQCLKPAPLVIVFMIVLIRRLIPGMKHRHNSYPETLTCPPTVHIIHRHIHVHICI